MVLTEKDFTLEFCTALVAEHGDIEHAAQAISAQCVSERYSGRPVAWRTVRNWISARVGPQRNGVGMGLTDRDDPSRINRIEELLRKANIDPEKIGAIRSARVKSYGVAMKLEERTIDPDTGKVVVTQKPHELGLHATDVTLSPIVPDFPLVQAAPPTKIVFRATPRIARKTRTVIVYSDAQIGFLRDLETDEPEPIHDPLALEVAEQITADLAPDEQSFIGDWMDWPTFSRWPQHPEMRRTLQLSVDEGHRWKARLRAAAPRKAKAVEIGSNHGYRPEKFILEHNLEAVGLRRACSQPAEWPVFSEPYLLRYDELGIAFSGQYPGGEHYLTEDLVLMHAPPKRLEMRASVIHGHTHRLTRTTAVSHGHDGRATYFVYDIGCLCQLGTTTNRRRLMVTRVPSDRGRTDWAQGLAVVEIIEAAGSRPAFHAVEQIAIHEGGWAQFRGTTYEARSRAAAA